MTSILPLKPFLENNIDEELPNLHPLHHTISLRKTNIYEEKNFYRKIIFSFLNYYLFFN